MYFQATIEEMSTEILNIYSIFYWWNLSLFLITSGKRRDQFFLKQCAPHIQLYRFLILVKPYHGFIFGYIHPFDLAPNKILFDAESFKEVWSLFKFWVWSDKIKNKKFFACIFTVRYIPKSLSNVNDNIFINLKHELNLS